MSEHLPETPARPRPQAGIREKYQQLVAAGVVKEAIMSGVGSTTGDDGSRIAVVRVPDEAAEAALQPHFPGAAFQVTGPIQAR